MDKVKRYSKHFVDFRFLRYFVIGVLSVAIDFGLFNLFLYGLNSEPLPANMASLFLSMVFNFLMSNFWTFQMGRESIGKKARRYLVISVINYIINNTLLFVMITYLEFHPLLAKVIVTGLQISWTFLIYKFWVFAPEPVSEST